MPDTTPKSREVTIRQKAGSRAQGKAASWVRRNYPETWAEMYQAAIEVERERMAERERQSGL